MFTKKINLNSNKECYDFLANHSTYDTMNSWNKLRSIAHNVKVWNLPVDNTEALQALEEDQYATINATISDWEDEHPGYEVGFNGRNGGYLVLTSKGSNAHVFENDPDSPCFYPNYEDWKESVKQDYGTLTAYRSSLLEQVNIVMEFDKLCDDLIDVLKDLIDDMKSRQSRTRSFEARLTEQKYTYPDINDMMLHVKQMEDRGYTLLEMNSEELYATFQMNEPVSSEYTLEEGDPLLEKVGA